MEKILVALDFEDQSLIALKYAKYFAKKFQYNLDVITVLEESVILSKMFGDSEMRKVVKEDVEKNIDKVTKNYKDIIEINKIVVFGKPYEKIIEYAKRTKPKIIIMGKSEMPKYKRAFLGSNSLHVILECDIPVITIRGDYDFEKYKNSHKDIMVPLDLNKSVSEQINASISFAKLMKSSLYLYSVERTGSKGAYTKMLSQMAKLKKAVIDSGVDCRIDLIQDDTTELYKLINDASIKANSSLIVIMTRSESMFSQLFLGSHARSIINNADIPVMSIEPWDDNIGSPDFSMIIDVLGVLN